MGELDRVSLVGLRAFGRHGVLAEERIHGQEFIIDATLWLDTRSAAASDDLTQTVSYADVAQQLHKIVTGEPVQLIETLAERLAQSCLAHERIKQVEITVHKPSAPIPLPFQDVTVTVRRPRA